MSQEFFIAHEAWVKLSVFLGLLFLLDLLEVFLPLRAHTRSLRRWFSNFGMIAISTALLRLCIPIAAFHFIWWPSGLEIILTLIAMDFAIYWQHRTFHYSNLLWRAHRVHHSDTEFDVSLGIRFHAFEILPSMLFKLLMIAVLGAAPIAVLLYESLLLGFSLFTHANIKLPNQLDVVLKKLLVTPNFHRVHHSVYREETDSNYGNILSCWDRMFRTYRPLAHDEQTQMTIGLPEFRSPSEQGLLSLLLQPFRNPKSIHSDNKHA
jgi:sterol desaturase/sphingolipid hydroxylase (fatty acid hydroxylase superfamily)